MIIHQKNHHFYVHCIWHSQPLLHDFDPHMVVSSKNDTEKVASICACLFLSYHSRLYSSSSSLSCCILFLSESSLYLFGIASVLFHIRDARQDIPMALAELYDFGQSHHLRGMLLRNDLAQYARGGSAGQSG